MLRISIEHDEHAEGTARTQIVSQPAIAQAAIGPTLARDGGPPPPSLRRAIERQAREAVASRPTAAHALHGNGGARDAGSPPQWLLGAIRDRTTPTVAVLAKPKRPSRNR